MPRVHYVVKVLESPPGYWYEPLVGKTLKVKGPQFIAGGQLELSRSDIHFTELTRHKVERVKDKCLISMLLKPEHCSEVIKINIPTKKLNPWQVKKRLSRRDKAAYKKWII